MAPSNGLLLSGLCAEFKLKMKGYSKSHWNREFGVNELALTDFVRVMITPRFLTASERAELERIVCRPNEDHGVARRVNAILLLQDYNTNRPHSALGYETPEAFAKRLISATNFHTAPNGVSILKALVPAG